MKKTYKITGLVIAGMLVVALANTLVNKEITDRYHQLAGNKAVTQAFLYSDQTQIKTISQQYGLQYQRIRDGRVVAASRPGLPTPLVVRYKTRTAPGVLKSDINQSLLSLTPYRLFIGRAIYMMFPICGDDCQAETYLIYSKVLL